MASVQSLGISTPSAIPALVAEGILPPDPAPSLYTWRTFAIVQTPASSTFEELLYTDSCVAWSRGGLLQKLYRFDIESEAVKQAIFATFADTITKNAPVPDLVKSPGGPAADKYGSSLVDWKRKTYHPTNQGTEPTAKSETKEGSEDRHTGEAQGTHRAQHDEGGSRALVVFLKTQAHIYFLSGTHHLVHLPFDVASAFPLPSGILLQRPAVAEELPQMPTAPDNSFAASYLGNSVPTRKPPFGENEQIGSNECPPIIKNMLDSVIGQKPKRKDSNMPAHFFLRDPLAELDVLVESTSSDPFNASTRIKRSGQNKKIDANETVIYLSKDSDLAHMSRGAGVNASALLAVTTNRITGHYSIWRVLEALPAMSKGRLSLANSGAATKRRSSFGPGTGANTPGLRTSIGPRESFGYHKETSGDSVVHDDFDLAATLDPSFDNTGTSLKSNRRISSLLARSSNRDASTLADVATSQVQGLGIRRGQSFGGHTTRKSLGRRDLSSSQPENESTASNARAEASTDSSDSEGEASTPPQPGNHFTSEPKHKMAFSKLYSFSGPSLSSFSGSHPSGAPSLDVFTLSPPPDSQHHASQSVLCIMDGGTRQFFMVHITASLKSSDRKKRGTKSQTELDIKVTDVRNGRNVVDACKVSEGSYSRVVVLTEDDGIGQLSLQSPWSTQIAIEMPSKFLIHNPFDHSKALTQKREGGFKRVLSRGADTIVSLRSCPADGQFQVCDTGGVLHRLQVRMGPRSGFVSKAIRVCEFVIPEARNEKEPLLRAWLEVMPWLAKRTGDGDNIEWRALVIVLFSMFVGFLGDSPTKPTQSRRKGGILRSSSGANMDLGSFEEMMSKECLQGNPSPPWLQQGCWDWMPASAPSRQKRSLGPHTEAPSPLAKKIALLPELLGLAREFAITDAGIKALGASGYLPTALLVDANSRKMALPTMLLALHLLREESKLNILASEELHALTLVLAQMGGWLDWDDWGWRPSSFYMLENADMDRWIFNETFMSISGEIRQPISPPSILEYVENVNNGVAGKSYPTLIDISHTPRTNGLNRYTPRTYMLLKLLKLQDGGSTSFARLIGESGLDVSILDTLPEGVAAPLRSLMAISQMQANAGTSLPPRLLEMIDRNDISMLHQHETASKPQFKSSDLASHEATRDFHAICSSTFEMEQVSAYDGSAEMDRQAVTRMVFKDDQRFAEAAKLVHPLKPAIATCYPEPDWSDTDLLEAQQEIAKVVAIRTLSVSPGRSMLFYSARFPLLTEKFPIHGFSLSCVMKPNNTTVTAEKSIYTEEKVSWAFFHAGVEAGLSISKHAKGINTSWILFNKPVELNNRHAGFLLALGLNGHLKSIAKWVAFKYLTPKHPMTSIGLLLGLSASYIGTMDTLITRLLSVHVTRMLPPGAAELNLSPLTQTTGIMAIGILYCNTQHRRMSEVMLSEMENIEQDDTVSPMDNLRDEGYRLAAGFALGFINLGQGLKLKGLRDMRIVERLLALAVATKRVDLVHILDKATAAATIAVALIFMKTEDEALAKKIDIPDTTHQFEYVRPDIFLLRTVARHLIMWNGITPSFSWIRGQLPPSLKDQSKLGQYSYLHSEQLPLFNIIAGLCLSIGLRFAGTARQDVRNLLVHYLDCFMKITATVGTSYDEKLTRITSRNCQDVVALAAASVMAGTGDICLFRRLRILHGRTDTDTPFGSHLAAHQAIGVLFLGGGTHTFGTSDLAVASLLCAFYPLFPTSVLDNKSHLQAFRHFWVLACEPRCLVIRSVESCRPLALQVLIVLRSGEELEARAPCLLPALDSIARIESNDPQYWPVTLDFAGDPAHRIAFDRHQSLFVRRRGAYGASSTIFGTTIRALNEAAMAHQLSKRSFEWVFSLPSFEAFDRAERTLVLPADGGALVHSSSRSTAVDSRLVLERGCLESGRAERLWDLRVLFSWAGSVARKDAELNWLGKEVLDALRAKVALMGRAEEV